ncbi:hypothetical protein ACHAXR_003077 [Thalassiosira sp. AJA248-18]
MPMMNHKLLATTALLASRLLSTAAKSSARVDADDPDLLQLPHQSLPTPYHGQHVGVSYIDLNGDGAIDLLFAAGRHWIDQSYALINLGVEYDDDDDNHADGGSSSSFVGVRFSEALPVGVPGGYYQIDVVTSSSSSSSGGSNSDEDDDGSMMQHSTVLLVGGTCHVETPNSFGSCQKGENTPARVVEVTMNKHGCSIHNPDVECHLEYKQVWEHPDPKGDRNGGFATFNDRNMIALLGQGGIELFQSVIESSIPTHSHSSMDDEQSFLHTSYSSVFHHSPPSKTDPRSDYARYAGFAAGHSPSLGGVIAAGRRSDYDAPEKDANGHIIGINKVIYEDTASQTFRSSTLPADVSGEPYPGDARYSIQTTNYAYADINGDGVQDLLEATFLYGSQRMLGYPLPQRIHFMDEEGGVKETLVVLEDGSTTENESGNSGGSEENETDAGRSVTTGQIFSDSSLPDVVFASAEGVVTLFANLGVDERTGDFRGLEQRYRLSVGTDKCEVRDVVVTKLGQDQSRGKCWVGIICAVTCGVDVLGMNHIFYVEGNGTVCNGDGVIDTTNLTNGALLERVFE